MSVETVAKPKRLTNLEFVALYKAEIAKENSPDDNGEGGTMTSFVTAYREATNSQAKSESLKSACSQRISAIRKELQLEPHNLTQEKVFSLIPKFKRATNISDGIDAVAEFLMGGGESKPSK